MKFWNFKFLAVLLSSFLILGCSTAPVDKTSKTSPPTSSPKTVQAPIANPLNIPASQIDPNAKRFLNMINAGNLMMNVFNREMEKETAKNPNIAELLRRAFTNLTANDFENYAARVYTRHLNPHVLEDLANFTQGSAGNRFFKSIFTNVAEGRPIKQDEIMGQFNADELTTLLKFFQSDSFLALQKELPTINKELGEEGEKLGTDLVKYYIQNSH